MEMHTNLNYYKDHSRIIQLLCICIICILATYNLNSIMDDITQIMIIQVDRIYAMLLAAKTNKYMKNIQIIT